MKQVKKSLVVFALVLAITAVVTFLIPSRTQGMSSNTPKQPDGAFSFFGHGENVIALDPAGTSYAITSLTISNPTENSIGLGGVSGNFGDTNDCQSFLGQPPAIAPGPIISIPAGQTVHLSFPQPFVISPEPGRTSCLVTTGGGQNANYTVVGYRF
jgi:hypothetical protein